MRISQQIWPEGTVPVVSICCITYQHVNFIRDAIEGFLMQETTFPVEIIIHDDASTDGTADVLRSYEEKFSQLFRIILQKENQYSTGRWPKVRKMLYSLPRGEFVALCEGDDYWTSPHKLQKQVEVLQADASMVGGFHAVKVTDEDGILLGRVPSHGNGGTLAFEDIIAMNDRATCSMIFRNLSPRPDLSWARDLPMGDWPLQATLTVHGQWVMLPAVMGVYRKHSRGVWSSAGDQLAMRGALSFYDAAVKKFGSRAHNAVNERRKRLLVALLYGAIRRGDWNEAGSLLNTLPWRDRSTVIVYAGFRAVVRSLQRCAEKSHAVFPSRLRTR